MSKLGSFNTLKPKVDEEKDIVLSLTAKELKKQDYESDTTIMRLVPQENKKFKLKSEYNEPTEIKPGSVGKERGTSKISDWSRFGETL